MDVWSPVSLASSSITVMEHRELPTDSRVVGDLEAYLGGEDAGMGGGGMQSRVEGGTEHMAGCGDGAMS